MKIIKLEKTNLKKTASLAKEVLDQDGLVIIPTDTVYVLAAKATSSKAAQKILDFKGRWEGKGISVFLNNLSKVKDYVECSQDQERILETILPGFFTVVLKSKKKVAPEIEPGDDTVGIRIIDESFVKALTKICDYPVTATSANITGKGPHYSIDSFLKTLSEKKKKEISLIIDAGQLPRRKPSTVFRLVKDQIEIIREGSLNPKLVLKEKTDSEAKTKKLAQKIYQQFFKEVLESQALVVIMRGDLGTGKTVFAKGLGELFKKELTSPTFVLMDEYQINQKPIKNIYHLDLYRLESDEEVVDLNLARFLEKGNLILIEWGEKLSTFHTLKKANTAFFLLQIEDLGGSKRGLKLYRI
jgi:L-threonylcarbamoyladenylate synthase